MARLGPAGLGKEWRGMAGRDEAGKFCRGQWRQGADGYGMAGKDWIVPVWCNLASRV